MLKTNILPFAVLLLIFSWQPVSAQDVTPAKPAQAGAEKSEADRKKLFARFEKQMTNVKLVGKFTIVGRDTDKLSNEEYTIRSVKKLPQGNMWAFATRVKYGNIDLPVTLNLPVEWAGDTPMVSLTELTLPGLGTFSARVVFYNKKYAGTWTHGKVGGHLFGTIEAIKPDSDAKSDSAKK